MKDNIFGSEAFILLTEMEMHYRRNKFQNFLQNLALDAHDGLHRKSTLAFIRVATLHLGFTAKLKSNYGQIRPNHFPTGPNFTIFSGQISWLYRMRKYNKIAHVSLEIYLRQGAIRLYFGEGVIMYLNACACAFERKCNAPTNTVASIILLAYPGLLLPCHS